MPASSRTDNPAAYGIMTGLGTFLTSYVNMRMTMKEFNLDVEKFEEAKSQNASQNEIARRQVMARERGNDLTEDRTTLMRELPWLIFMPANRMILPLKTKVCTGKSYRKPEINATSLFRLLPVAK